MAQNLTIEQMQGLASTAERASAVDLDGLQQHLQELLRGLPVAGLLPAMLGLLVGFLLWWYGERFLRLALMLLGIFVGVPFGMAIGAAFAPALPPVIAASIGAVALMVIAAVGLKFAVAGGLAVLLGLAGVIGSIGAVQRGWIELDPPAPAAVRWVGDAGVHRVAFRQEASPQQTTDASEPVGHWQEIRLTLERGQNWIGEAWAALAPQARTLVVASGSVGALLGFGIGLIFRRGAMRLATALLGSILILTGGTTVLAWAFPDFMADRLPGTAWLGLWGVLAVGGGILQWKRSAARADNARG
jgi:hypothetical protein